MKNKKEKVQILADRLTVLLPLIDGFMNELDDEDFELLKECKESLKEKININNSAMPLIMACGRNYNDKEDTMKLKTLDCIIELIKARKEFKEIMQKSEQENQNKQDVLKLFGLI